MLNINSNLSDLLKEVSILLNQKNKQSEALNSNKILLANELQKLLEQLDSLPAKNQDWKEQIKTEYNKLFSFIELCLEKQDTISKLLESMMLAQEINESHSKIINQLRQDLNDIQTKNKEAKEDFLQIENQMHHIKIDFSLCYEVQKKLEAVTKDWSVLNFESNQNYKVLEERLERNQKDNTQIYNQLRNIFIIQIKFISQQIIPLARAIFLFILRFYNREKKIIMISAEESSLQKEKEAIVINVANVDNVDLTPELSKEIKLLKINQFIIEEQETNLSNALKKDWNKFLFFLKKFQK